MKTKKKLNEEIKKQDSNVTELNDDELNEVAGGQILAVPLAAAIGTLDQTALGSRIANGEVVRLENVASALGTDMANASAPDINLSVLRRTETG